MSVMPESIGLVVPGQQRQRNHCADRQFGKHRADHALTPVVNSEGE
jgi:hypothetical protein